MATINAVRRRLVAAKLIHPGARWSRLVGGRTNAVFKVSIGGDHRVCKISDPMTSSHLFANRPRDEARCMQALAGKRIAPYLIGTMAHGASHCLVYHFVDGPAASFSDPRVPRLLRHLHSAHVPNALLPQRALLEAALVGTFEASFEKMGFSSGLRSAIRTGVDRAARRSFHKLIHGDPVAANIIDTSRGPVLIDWQNVCIGDPVRDIAIAVSPAMAVLYGAKPMTGDEIDRFLANYGCAKTECRYRSFAPALHMQILTHCAWKANRGESDYATAIDLEAAHLRAIT